MSFFTLYLLFLKATLSSFSGLAALPILRDDLIVQRRLVTDRDLNTALLVGRTTPGPKGLYIVSLGYYAGGFTGAVAAWLALATPALLVIPLLVFAARRARDPRVKQMLQAIVLGSAGVSLTATLPLAADAIHGPLSLLIAIASLGALLAKDVDTLWAIAAGALAGLAVFAAGTQSF